VRKLSPYAVMTIISLVIRQFVIPNPFECFGNDAIAINWIAEPIIQAVSYAIVGVFYIKGSAPAVGSFLYLIVYALIVVFLWILSIFSFAWWWGLIVVVAIIALTYGGTWIKGVFVNGKKER